jgi:vacuolar-type H+-ATPase subunit I/STV1
MIADMIELAEEIYARSQTDITEENEQEKLWLEEFSIRMGIQIEDIGKFMYAIQETMRNRDARIRELEDELSKLQAIRIN